VGRKEQYYFAIHVVLMAGIYFIERKWPEISILGIFYLSPLVLGVMVLRKYRFELKEKELELTKLNDQLKSKHEDLEEFIYTVSHDIRSPLITINGFVEILKDLPPLTEHTETKHLIDRVLYNVKYLDRMLKELLKISTLYKRPVEFKPIEIKSILNDVKNDLGENILQAQATIDLEENLPIILGQPDLIAQLFTHVISNGLKYRKETEKVHIKIGVGKADGAKQTIFFRDNGVGIEAKNFEKVFKLFHKCHLENAEEAVATVSMGAGMTIAKKIMERHQGRIWFESEVGKGTVFYLQF
jgi:chemotaxis family two-component system sensor kinase Cph1